LLRAENHRVPSPDPTDDDILDGRLDDAVYFRVYLGLSEAARRRWHWSSAEDFLLAVEHHSAGDARRAAAVHYRLSRLYIDRWRHEMPDLGLPAPEGDTVAGTAAPDAPVASGGKPATQDLPTMAVRRAVEAILIFREMGNLVGIVRAQCQHVRALVIAGHLVQAEQLTHMVWQSLAGPELKASPARTALMARFYRARGELLLQRCDIVRAWRTLAGAATLYAANDDWASHAEIWQLLGCAQRRFAYPTDAGLAGMDAALDELISSVGTVEHMFTGPQLPSTVLPRQREGAPETP
jgi:hypothetical protein